MLSVAKAEPSEGMRTIEIGGLKKAILTSPVLP